MKKIILLFCFAAITTLGFSQVKVFSNGTTINGDNSSMTSSPKQFTIVDSQSPVNRLHFGKSPAGFSLSNNLFDITPGPTGSLRVGAFNLNNVALGGAGFQAWSDSAPSGIAGSFYFDAGAVSTAEIVFRTGLQKRMVINQAGNIAIGGNFVPTATVDVMGTMKVNGISVSSDKQLKSNINPFGLGLDEVLQLNPVAYEYNGKGGTVDGGQHVGIIAQELQKVAPMLVEEYTHIEVEANRDVSPMTNDVIAENTYLSIKDNEIKYLLINAIKDQQVMIENQAEKIAVLENAISTIGSSETINNTNITLSTYDLAELDQNTPNPFNAKTTIAYVIPSEAKDAQISVYGQNGQLMKTLDIGHVGKGTLTVDAINLPPGTYSYRLVVDGRNIQTNMMVVAK